MALDLIYTLSGWLDIVFSPLIKNIISAAIILLIGLTAGRIIGKVSKKIFREIQLNKIARKLVEVPFDVDSVFSYFFEYLTYFVTVAWALQTMQIAKAVLYVALAVVIIFFLLSIFLGVRDFSPNFIATIFLKRKGSVRVGDKITSEGVEGTVERIGIVKTQVRTESGDTLFLSNLSVLKARIKSRKKKEKHRNKILN